MNDVNCFSDTNRDEFKMLMLLHQPELNIYIKQALFIIYCYLFNFDKQIKSYYKLFFKDYGLSCRNVYDL